MEAKAEKTALFRLFGELQNRDLSRIFSLEQPLLGK